MLFLTFVIPITQKYSTYYLQCGYINWKVHTGCDLNFILKGHGLLKVTGSHVQLKSGNILATVLDRDSVTTGH